jgi:hypothetical protein
MERIFFKVDSSPYTIHDLEAILAQGGLSRYSAPKLLIKIGAMYSDGVIARSYRDVFFYYTPNFTRSINPSQSITVNQAGLTEAGAYKIISKMLVYIVKHPARCLK